MSDALGIFCFILFIMNFIKIKCISGFHILSVSDILSVSPKGGEQNKSEVSLRNVDYKFFSTETQEEIFDKINLETTKQKQS